MIHPTNPNALRVKRDGPRGWHWIDASQFQPGVHVLADDEAPAVAATPQPAAPQKKGRRK